MSTMKMVGYKKLLTQGSQSASKIVLSLFISIDSFLLEVVSVYPSFKIT